MSTTAGTPSAEEPEDSGALTAFYRAMTTDERRTFWGCAAGWTLDGMDFMIYPLVLGTIMAQWQVAAGPAGFAATLTLLSSAIGGWLAGWISDRIGRVRTLQLTILWFSVFSLLCAFAQNFEQLMVLRLLLGFGFGGEWAAGAVLMGETIRARYRGRAVGTVQSGWAVGWGLAVLAQAVIFSLLPPEEAWRAMFAIGFLPALLVLYLRRAVKEPEVAVTSRAMQGKAPLSAIFAPGVLRTTILAAAAMTGVQGGYYAVMVWVPTFLKTERGLTVVGSTPYLAFLILGAFCGFLTGAWLADRIGRRPLFLVFSLCAILTTLAYMQLPISNEFMLVLGFPLGFFAHGAFSGCGPFLTELFPGSIRGSAQGFCYNFGRGIGALFPTLVGYLSGSFGLAAAIAIFGVAANLLFFGAAYALPETRGRVLEGGR